MRNLAGKRAIVTGAASGIGREIAVQLADKGTHLALWDRDAEGLVETQRRCREGGVDSICRVVDLTSVNEITTGIDELRREWPPIDILINNAGVGFEGPTHEMSAEQWQSVIEINLLAPITMIQLLLPTLLSRPQAHILNVASMLGLCPVPKGAAYCSSKYGLVGLSEAMRWEYRRTPLGVSVLCPGFVHTRLFEHGQGGDPKLPIRKPPSFVFTTPEVVARKGVRAIERNRAKVLVTPLARCMFFLNRHLPSTLELLSMIGRRKGPRPTPRDSLSPLLSPGQLQ